MKAKKILWLWILFVCGSGWVRADYANVEIHHLGVGQGDGTLIYFEEEEDENTYKGLIVIDAGNSKSKGELMYRYIRDTMITGRGLQGVYAIVVSHLHTDHYGGMKGLLAKLRKDNIPVQYFIDRTSQAFLWPTGNANDPVCFDNPTGPTFQNYTNAVNNFCQNTNCQRVTVSSGSGLISAFNPKDLDIYVVAANGSVGGDSYLAGPQQNVNGSLVNTPLNENDLSFAIVVECAGFRYFTGGDIGGANPYSDGETPITDYVLELFPECGYHYCSMKVSHHGSTHSTNDYFVDNLEPTLAVVPSALRTFNGTALPGQATLELLRESCDTVFYTFVPNNPDNPDSYYLAGNAQYYNDVILKVNNPGYDQDVTMTMICRARRKSKGMNYTGAASVCTVVCDKQHDFCEHEPEEELGKGPEKNRDKEDQSKDKR